jgi:hypothetical protein
MLVTIVGGMFAMVALIGWGMYRWANSMDRAARDPKYMRRKLYFGAAIYGFAIFVGVSQVLSGAAPPATLFGALIPILLVYFLLRTAKRVKTPPE